MPAFFTAFLLVACAMLALRVPRSVVSRGVGLVLAGLLVLASLDEAAEFHERLETRTGVDWQLLYIPVFLAVLVVFGRLVLGLRRSGFGLAPILGAAACWALAQTLEALQSEDGPAPGYTWMMVTEETLEMVGSALLLVALLTVLGADPAKRSGQPPRLRGQASSRRALP